MNFLRLQDPLISVLFEDDDILAIDKPYGLNAHTNDSKIEHSDFVQDGLIEIYEKHLGTKLHIIHRLDQTTTGVMIFGKSAESAKKYAEFFFDRMVKKTYWFITQSKSAKSEFLIDKQIIHKGRELEAKTQLSILKKSSPFELWKAQPFTGRNHQIRIHAKTAGISILGDAKYDGHAFPFLCLHNHRIEFPNGIVITSKPPIYYENLLLLNDLTLTKAIFETDRRRRLFFSSMDSDQCIRLVHNRNNSNDPGFTVDQLGKNLLLTWHKPNWGPAELKKFQTFSNLMNRPIVIRVISDKNKISSQLSIFPEKPIDNTEPIMTPWIAKENQTQYELRPDSSASMGLFLDQRLQRNWLRTSAKNKKVLSLFSFNGTFALAAALGKADQVTCVDTSKGALNWGKKNIELNGLNPAGLISLCRDSLTFLDQCKSKGTKYDLIICDAPSFLKREKGVFKIKSDLEGLLENCLSCLNSKGELLFSTHFDEFFIGDIQKIILKVQKKMKLSDLTIDCILPALDFELADEKANLKSFILRLN